MYNKIKLAKNIICSNFMRLSSPYKIMAALTYKCNLKCKICRVWANNSGKNELTLDELASIFKNLKNLSWLDLTGGELTLREDLSEIIKTITTNARNLAVLHISSNGQLPEKILQATKNILHAGLIPIVNISIDGPRFKNDELRGLNGAYSKSLETFKLLKSLHKGYYILSCTISDCNIDHINRLIEEIKKDIPDFSFHNLHFNIFHHSSHYYKNTDINYSSRMRFDEIKKYLKLCSSGGFIKIILENKYVKGLNKYLGNNKFPLECQALKSSCFINPYGEVYPCGFYDKPIGNLRDYGYNLNKLWDSPASFKIRNNIKNKDCPGCWTPCEAYPSILGSLLNC